MIRIGKRGNTPNSLKGRKATELRNNIAEKVAKGEDLRSKDFPGKLWRKDDVRPVLWKLQHKKCCYCERLRDVKLEPDIEHFRPKTEVRDATNNLEHRPGYWWLAYNWKNYFFCCKRCNVAKSSKFPLHQGVRAREPGDKLSAECPVVPDPEREDPETLIGWHWDFDLAIAVPVGLDPEGRGAAAIHVLKLNNPELNEERGRELDSWEALVISMTIALRERQKGDIERHSESINDATRSNKRFAGLARRFFRAHKLGSYVAKD